MSSDGTSQDPSLEELLDSLLARCTFPAPGAEPGAELVCAVSGGADSLALLVLARRAGLNVTAVHVDHGLRPGSAAEADVVAAAAERFGAGFRAETVTVEPGSDLENRARRARHAVLGPDAMTGHTADDQAETVLINLLRGAGLDGIAAMEPGFRHPILSLRRAETKELCRRLGLDPIDDPSNRNPRFVRNRIRHEVLPLLADISGRDPVPLLIRSADLAREAAADIDTLAAELDPTDCLALRSALPAVAHQAIRRWLQGIAGYPPSAAELGRVMNVVRGEVVACEIEPGLRISRSDQRLSADSVVK